MYHIQTHKEEDGDLIPFAFVSNGTSCVAAESGHLETPGLLRFGFKLHDGNKLGNGTLKVTCAVKCAHSMAFVHVDDDGIGEELTSWNSATNLGAFLAKAYLSVLRNTWRCKA
jgi:hypothetical protein